MGQVGTLGDSQWFVQQNGKSVGPLTLTVLRQLAGIGHIRSDTWLQPAGTDVWVRAETVLKNAFAPRAAAPAPVRAPVAQVAHAPGSPQTTGSPRVSSPPVRPRQVSADSGPPTIRLHSAPSPAAAAAMTMRFVATECVYCHTHFRIGLPRGPEVHQCPKCAKSFRVVVTSVGVVARGLDGSGHTTVHNTATPRTSVGR